MTYSCEFYIDYAIASWMLIKLLYILEVQGRLLERSHACLLISSIPESLDRLEGNCLRKTDCEVNEWRYA